MRVLIQRVTKASVSIDGKIISQIGPGYLLLFGAGEGDGEKEAEILAEKIVNLRIMSDENGKMNLSLLDKKAGILVVSQFTLYADVKGGRRPSFTEAAKPETADKLYQHFASQLKKYGVAEVKTGVFGQYMSVELINDGPVTIMIDTEDLIIKNN